MHTKLGLFMSTFLVLIDWFQRHVNPSRVIICLGGTELCSLYDHFFWYSSFAHGSIVFELFVNRTIWPKQMETLRGTLPFWVRVNLGVIVMKGNFTHPQISRREALPSDAVYCYTQDIHLTWEEGVVSLQGIQSTNSNSRGENLA